MVLSRDDAELVIRLHCSLMQYVMEQVQNVGVTAPVAAFQSLPAGQRLEVVKAFLGRLELIDAFIAANPARLSEQELEIVSSWRYLVAGRFIALRQMKKYMVFLTCDGKSTAYGVTGLVHPIEQVIPQPLPAMVDTVLLPFRGQIIYDGLLSSFNVTFGPGSRRAFEDDYRTAKATKGIVTSLPWEAPPSKPGADVRKLRPSRPPQRQAASAQDILKQVLAMTDAFCQAHLNEEYMALCQKLAEKLAAKRPSPLLRGEPKTWASGIIRTIGWVNFLDDPSQAPHLKFPAIDRALGVAESTGQGKALAIRQMLNIRQCDHRWTLPSRWESTPLIWILQDSNGRMFNIRQQPVAVQRAAFKKGLIPYVPADREAAAVQARISTSTSRRLFQFKITLRDVTPAIWRRIQVFDDTLDKLHEHIQAAMGWTNSHLHRELLDWNGPFNPEVFSPLSATHLMQEGIPDWRKMV